ncbi:hypothetical protein Hdeb2414_s0012g00389961 [Helianthus debilis subsp. tardiflorus]
MVDSVLYTKKNKKKKISNLVSLGIQTNTKKKQFSTHLGYVISLAGHKNSWL